MNKKYFLFLYIVSCFASDDETQSSINNEQNYNMYSNINDLSNIDRKLKEFEVKIINSCKQTCENYSKMYISANQSILLNSVNRSLDNYMSDFDNKMNVYERNNKNLIDNLANDLNGFKNSLDNLTQDVDDLNNHFGKNGKINKMKDSLSNYSFFITLLFILNFYAVWEVNILSRENEERKQKTSNEIKK